MANKSRSKAGIAAMLVVCAIAVAAGAWFSTPRDGYALTTVTSGVATHAKKAVAKSKSKAKSKAATPSSVGALNTLMTGDGKYVYFAEQSVEPGAGPTLRKVSRMRADGSGYQCLYEGVDGDFISGIRVSGQWLVVSMGDDIISMKKDGSEAHVIVAAAMGYPRGGRFAVHEGEVYYPIVAGPGAWEIRSCAASGSASSVVCAGEYAQGSLGPQVEGVAGGRVVFTTGEQQGGYSCLYTLWSAPIAGGDADELGKSFFGRAAVTGGRACFMYGGSFRSILPDGSDHKEVCAIPGNGDGRLYNVTDDVAYIGMGSKMWRVSLPEGKTTALGEQHFESGSMEIVDGKVYFHYGIEGAICKVDASMANQGEFWRP
ncbi:MAG: hypothetical protein IKG18_04495 [Atopobiaceae bacterium]|nr:hypothetical protein [Atopobiaceae bacterium]MBR3313381.1 hypothetical protein [Atopobiaceae bacterium]